MAATLLVGNGPNHLTGGASWQNVVRAAARHLRLTNVIEQVIDEPLPLVYETMASRYPLRDRETKAVLADRMLSLKPNDVQRRLMNLAWPTVLTTNYDYCLETASSERFASENTARESSYSLFRRWRSGVRSVWHIHGELGRPQTMMLGLHQYAGSLQKMRQYLTVRSAGSPFLAEGSNWTPDEGRHSWADLFLRDDVHIVGFSFDYAETHLWWLLSYKQRLRHLRRVRIGSTTFYQFGKQPRSDERLRLMMALDVKVRAVPAEKEHPNERDWGRLLEMLEKVDQ
jgi:SIR2-like protein